MTLTDVLLICARCKDKAELAYTDVYTRKYLACQFEKHGVTAEFAALEEWNEALELFGAGPAANADRAREQLLSLLYSETIPQRGFSNAEDFHLR